MRVVILSTLSLPLLALACAPVTRSYPPGSGGATSSSSAETSSASTGGAGGSGGGVPTGSCVKVGLPFDVLSSNDLGAKAQLQPDVLLASDQENVAMVHVIVKDYNQNQVDVRTVLGGVKPLGSFSSFGSPTAPPFSPRAAWAVAGQLHVEGAQGNAVEELNVAVDPDNGVGPSGALKQFETPIECLQSGQLGATVFAQDGPNARYLAVCDLSASSMPSLLYAGGWTGKPVLVATAMLSEAVMRPTAYSFAGSTHLAFFANDGQVFFSYGPAVTDLGKTQAFRLTADPDARQGVFFAAPLPADDGVTLLSAHFNLMTDKGQFWTGATPTTSYATLSQVPPPGFASAQDIPTLKDAVTPTVPGWDAKGIVSAGTTPDNKGVHLFWLTRQGQPLVFGQEVYKAVDTTVLSASAAPLGDTTLVVWTEKTGSTTTTKYLVRGQVLSCTSG
jgi:hypothetical protein